MILIKEAKTKDEILQAIFLRRKVLVSENKYSIFESEPDKYDLIYCFDHFSAGLPTVMANLFFKRKLFFIFRRCRFLFPCPQGWLRT